MIKDIHAVCEKCLETIPGKIEIRDKQIWMTKECAAHGASEHLIDPDVEFYNEVESKVPTEEYHQHWIDIISTTGLDVTRKCNMKCPHCYVEPDNNEEDESIEKIVEVAKQVKKTESIILMGAEPTVRKDLPELIKAIIKATGKTVGMYTNAIALAKQGYAKKLKAAGLEYACVSLHSPEYINDPKVFTKKIAGITKLYEAGIPIHHVSFSLRTLKDLDLALADGLRLRGIAGHIRIRSPQDIGICEDIPIALSELCKNIIKMFNDAGHTAEILPSDNNMYHVNLLVDGTQVFRIIRWPTLAETILEEFDTPPYALFDKESGEVNLVLSFLLQEAKRNLPRNVIQIVSK
jgi:uncharacterized Fe-S cluster-containing radical SAM superfamily protein